MGRRQRSERSKPGMTVGTKGQCLDKEGGRSHGDEQGLDTDKLQSTRRTKIDGFIVDAKGA
eukprot:2795944-Karenia_brevis.AAC.1